MIKLFLLADDFTGALDACACFTQYDVKTRVVLAETLKEEDFDCDILAVATQTRHLEKKKAYHIIADLIRLAREHGNPLIYKKTDSALRGNIGAELSAALHAASATKLHFMPAFPQNDRITRGGIQYVSGVPVADSVFGKDPFDPVRHSAVAEIIAEQTDCHTVLVPVGSVAENGAGIVIYDAEREEDLDQIAKRIFDCEDRPLLAGCAGLASALPPLMGLQTKKDAAVIPIRNMLVICGSVNPISTAQCTYAQQRGASLFSIPKRAWQEKNWDLSSDAATLLTKIRDACFKGGITILRTEGISDPAAQNEALALQHSKEVQKIVGTLTKRLLDTIPVDILMVIGGDTLFGIMRELGIGGLSPTEEILPGIVLSEMSFKNVSCRVISKSGGFGKKDIIPKLYQYFS